MGIFRADYATSLYPQKLTLTSPTSGGRSVGIVWIGQTGIIENTGSPQTGKRDSYKDPVPEEPRNC
jgi:hypothetical protein